ncbi:hypothetical protein ACS0TY_017859 [Phlomoides rotata]
MRPSPIAWVSVAAVGSLVETTLWVPIAAARRCRSIDRLSSRHRRHKLVYIVAAVVVHRRVNSYHPSLRNLEIVGARLEDDGLSDALRACPNLTHLLLLGCEGLRYVSIQNPNLKQCKLDFLGVGICSLTIHSSKVESLEVQGCSLIKVDETPCLKISPLPIMQVSAFTEMYCCLCNRTSLSSGIKETCGIGNIVYQRSSMVLAGYKHNASNALLEICK